MFKSKLERLIKRRLYKLNKSLSLEPVPVYVNSIDWLNDEESIAICDYYSKHNHFKQNDLDYLLSIGYSKAMLLDVLDVSKLNVKKKFWQK